MGTSQGGGTVAQTATGMRAIVEELSEAYFERADVVRALAVSVLAGQHSLILGPPGTAKSDLARELTGRFDGAEYWEVLLSKFTDPKRLFGPIDVAALTQGRYTQVFEGRATTAHIAFIDEIFKCSAGALNEMLAFLNERLYHPENGGAPIVCPLVSAITASNELPSTEELSAIYDRLLVRVEVGYLADPSNFAKLVRSAVTARAPQARTTVDLAGLQHAVEVEVPGIEVPDGIVDAVCQLRAQLRRDELITSDRRWKQSIRLLQASAWLDDRTTVADTDLAVLRHVLWDSTTQQATVERAVLTLVDPNAREALDLLDAIDELDAQLDAKKGQSEESLSDWAVKEANGKLARAGKRLETLLNEAQAAGRSTETLIRVATRRKTVHARVMFEALGVDPSSLAGV